MNITVDGEEVEQVTDSTCLGIKINSDVTLDRELRARIDEATGTFNSLNNVPKDRSISVQNIVRIYVAAVTTILTYGGEI